MLLAALAACLLPVGGSVALARSTSTLATSGGITPAWTGGKPVHIFPTVPALTSQQRRLAHHKVHNELGQRAGTDPPLLYHAAGTVQRAPRVYLIWWGKAWTEEPGTATRRLVLEMFERLSGSTYQEILTQYFDEEKNITATVTIRSYIDETVAAPRLVTQERVLEEAAAAIRTNGWTREADAQFVVLTAPGTTYEAGFNEMNRVVFCAYHAKDRSNSSVSFDPYVGDEPFKRECQAYDRENNVSRVTSMLASHEYAESATDPLLNAWFTPLGYEISDICATSDDRLANGTWVQGQWDDNKDECALEHREPPKVYGITEAATGVTTTGATLNSTVNPEGTETRYHFEYGTTTGYGTSVPSPSESVGSGRRNLSKSNAITGLIAGTLYHFRVVTSNATGTMNGLDKTFTTSSTGEVRVLPEGSVLRPVSFRISSREDTFKSGALFEAKCKKDTGTGNITSKRLGTFRVVFEECTSLVGECRGLSSLPGQFVVEGEFHLRRLLNTEPRAVVAFFLVSHIHFTCGSVLALVLGCIAGLITPVNTQSRTGEISIRESGGKQAITEADTDNETSMETCGELKIALNEGSESTETEVTTEELSGFEQGGSAVELLIMA